MRIRMARTGARREGSSGRNRLRRSSDKKSCLAFRTTGVSGTAGKEPKVLIRRLSKQYVRRISAGSSHGPPVKSQDAADEPTRDVLGGMDNSDSIRRSSWDARATGVRVLCPPVDSTVSHSARSTDENPTYCPSLTNQARSGTGGGLFWGPRADRCGPRPKTAVVLVCHGPSG